MPQGGFARHPDLHPTASQMNDPNDIRLILPIKGIMPMGCAKGVVGYGMIHPNLINAAVLQYHGLTSLNQHFDAMALAPNFDLLLTQGSADEVAKLITSWKTDPHTLWAQGEMIVQAPLDPTKENMKYHQNCIDLKARTPVVCSMFQPLYHSSMSLHGWFPSCLQSCNITGRILELCYIRPCCVERIQRLFHNLTLKQSVAGVIEEQWLELLSDTDIEPLLGEGPEVRNLIHSRKGKAGNNLLWNMAGAIIQTGQWRSFPSLEQAWVMLARLWGMRAPNQVPTCTVWPTLSDKEDPIRMTKYKRHIKYLESYRATEEFPAASST